MAKYSSLSHSCTSCEAEFDLIPGNPEAYVDACYCPYCGAALDNNEEVVEWEDEEG